MGAKASRFRGSAQQSGREAAAASRVKNQPTKSTTQKSTDTAKESKDASILKDSQDPHFLENLKIMGQVKVPKHKLNYSETSSPMASVIRGRSKDAELTEMTEGKRGPQSIDPKRLNVNVLAALLDERKKRGLGAARELAKTWNVDPNLAESLSKSVNSVSILKHEFVKYDDSGDSREYYIARWVDTERPGHEYVAKQISDQ